MKSLNRWEGIGAVGKDPDIRHTTTGSPVANLSIACNERWKDASGAVREHVEWMKLSVFGEMANFCEKYIKKGSLIYVEGKIRDRKWMAKDGTERHSTETLCSNIILLRDPSQGASHRAGEKAKPDSSEYEELWVEEPEF